MNNPIDVETAFWTAIGHALAAVGGFIAQPGFVVLLAGVCILAGIIFVTVMDI